MKNKLNHHGHVLTSLDELETIFKRSHKIMTIKEKKELHFNGIHTFYNSIDFAYFEIISDRGYWFRIQKPLKELKSNKQKYYFSIYGESIACLELFKIYTHLKPITCNEFINTCSPGGI